MHCNRADAFRTARTLTWLVVWLSLAATGVSEENAVLRDADVVSSLDGTEQPIRWWAPEGADESPTALFVFLHSWSSDYRQNNDKWLRAAREEGWIYLHPNFRGVNDHPEACGSRLARGDILDAVDWAAKRWQVDPNRVYLCGVSGGGHMALLMAGHHPDRFSAVSAWVGISDLAEWHRFHTRDGSPGRYARMIEASLGGPPGESSERDAEYRDRSAVFHLSHAGDLPVDIMTGIRDGHTGSVPVSHSLRAFNAIASGRNEDEVPRETIDRLVRMGAMKDLVPLGDWAGESGRTVLFRAEAGPSRVTVFDGGHESLPASAVSRLKQFRREASGIVN